MTREEAIEIANDFVYRQRGISSEVKLRMKRRIEAGRTAHLFPDSDPLVHGSYWLFRYEKPQDEDGPIYMGMGMAVVVMEENGEVMTGDEHDYYVCSNGKTRRPD